MHPSNQSTRSSPVFPALLSLPLKTIPCFIHNRMLVAALNKIFYKNLQQGELDFLKNKLVRIFIEDTGIEFRISLNQNKLIPGDKDQAADLSLKGTVYNYLLLASRREDTDTLFFSRRLQMQGDTELGLYVKNFLDGIDLESYKTPAYLESALQKFLPVYERLFRL